jgi:CDP-4-dehydro-6-deoxyglucose reductase, E3
VRVSLANSSTTFNVTADQPVLDAALAASLRLPHSCRGGNCGSCRARLIEGSIHYPNGVPLGLSEAEVADGYVLLCQARARSDLQLEIVEINVADEGTIKRLPARVVRSELLSHDVVGLWLRLPAAETFTFEAGQYIDILLSGGRRRSFSIASPPHDSDLVELHVRQVPGGEFSQRLFQSETPSTLLNIEGPLGRFVYRAAPEPMLLIGGGTGIAPLLSILRHVVENDIERDMMLYWGVRSERDLYAGETLDALAERARSLRWIPVLSAASEQWQGASGWVHESALADVTDGASQDIYAAGPPEMVACVRRELESRGLGTQRLYSDSFDYASDALPRQRSNASTKS